MAYKIDGVEYDTIKIRKDGLIAQNESAEEPIKDTVISIINNSEIKFDISEIKYTIDDFLIVLEDGSDFCGEDEEISKENGFYLERRPDGLDSDGNLTQENTHKFRKVLIVAEYGDNSENDFRTEPIFLEIINQNSTEIPENLNIKFNSWDSWAHKFIFNKEHFDNFNEIRELKITLYNRFGHFSPFIINYKIEDDAKDIKFKVLSANIDNRGKISYMLDNIANKKSQIVLAGTKNPC